MQVGDRKNVTYRRHRYQSQEPPLDKEEQALELEARGKSIMSDKDEPTFSSLLSALNDLAKGQKTMIDLMGQLVVNTMGSHDKQTHNSERDSNNREGSHSHTTMQSHPHL